MFKVAQDQLKVSQGWVRCGQCEQVFDATAHLVQEPPALTTPLATPASGGGAAATAGSSPMAGASPKTWEEEMVEAEFGDLAAQHDAPLDDLQLETPDVSAWREPRFTEDPVDLPAPRAADPVARPELDGFPAPSAPLPRSVKADPYDSPRQTPPLQQVGPASASPALDDDGHGTAEALSFMRR
ncbi:zinc-ribbon domain-containing protein, partial [Leptospira sp. 96542]|nr:zinc-ribbon domain-containing protein [Leptospira sp. 96542]